MEIQDPFGKQANDLRIEDFNGEILDLVGEMWRRWVRLQDRDPAASYADGFGIRHVLKYANAKDRYKFY